MNSSHDISKDTLKQWLEDETSATSEDLIQSEEALIQYARTHSISPDPGVRNRIFDKIASLKQAQTERTPLHPDHLPILDEKANWMDWQDVVKDIQPPGDFQGIHLHRLESSPRRELFVAWVKEYVDEEMHTDIIESFVLLEGTCECHITTAEGKRHVVRMSAGDYITMHPGETHDVIITSLQPAKAILQWLKLSA